MEIALQEEQMDAAHRLWRFAARNLTDRAWRLLQLWAEGQSYDDIAWTVGYKGQRCAWIAVHRAMEQLKKVLRKSTGPFSISDCVEARAHGGRHTLNA